MRTIQIRNADTEARYRDEFRKVFGVELRGYWDNVTGFDIVKFDADFIPPKECAKEHIQKRFGQAGVNLILKLIAAEL